MNGFPAASALLFIVSAVLTAVWALSMPAMGGMPMAGGWTMSMMWMRMPGQTWPGLAAAFLGMWVVMMVAMMLPSLAPMLSRYYAEVARTGRRHPGWLTAVVGTGYFFVWTVAGAAVFPLGVVLAETAMRLPPLARAIPIAAGVILLISGCFQLTAWKARYLAGCRELCDGDGALMADTVTAWQHGVRLGLQCGRCCGNLMAILMVAGVMDLRAMAVVTAAITAERRAPAGDGVAQAIGIVVLGAAIFVIARQM